MKKSLIIPFCLFPSILPLKASTYIAVSNHNTIENRACSKENYLYLSLDIDAMNELYTKISNGDAKSKKLYNDIIKSADAEIKSNNIYTIVNKSASTPSGDKHDYISMAPYLWPDPSKPNGLPYKNRDGEINPESRTKYTDQKELYAMADAVESLGEAYFYSKNDKYAERVKKIINTFFLDAKTKMNPNLNFAQFIPGVSNGRWFGIIETTTLTKVMEGISLVSKSKKWDEKSDKAIRAWMKEYLHWLLNNDMAKKEGEMKNNHGTHYDRQCLSMMLFTGDVQAARDYIKTRTMPRLQRQIMTDGSQPQELRRTKSWNYTNMNMLGFYQIAMIGEKIGVDLWNYKNNGQVYLKSMAEWFLPYLNGEKEWKFNQIVKEPVTRIEPMLRMAASHYNDPRFISTINQFHTINKNIVYPFVK